MLESYAAVLLPVPQGKSDAKKAKVKGTKHDHERTSMETATATEDRSCAVTCGQAYSCA
jgi:hypothetical protein